MAGLNLELRRQVIAIYKGACICWAPKAPANRHTELLYLGREYPLGYDYFRPRLHKAFMAKAGERDEEKIRYGIKHAEYVRKGTSWSSSEKYHLLTLL